MVRQLELQATLLACLLTGLSVDSFNNPYCEIKTCPMFKHTMCQYPNDSVACPGEGVKAGLSEDLKKTIVALHNSYRQDVSLANNYPQPGASNMMVLSWNEEAAEFAQRWANQCIFQDDDCRDLPRQRVGQSVAEDKMDLLSPNVSQTIRNMVGAWYNEAKDQANFVKEQLNSFKSTTNNMGRIVGHYTQMVWAKTTAVGCGFIQLKAENNKFRKTHLVCNYVPGGNIKGKPVYRAGKAGTACPRDAKCSKSYSGLCTKDQNDFGKCPWDKDKGAASSLNPTVCLLLGAALMT